MENSSPPKKRKIAPFIILSLVLAIAAYFGISSLLHKLKYESTDNAQVETFSTPVVSRIAGYVDSVGTSDYEPIKNQQLLLTIDSRELKIAVDQAEADYQSAVADFEAAQASIINVGRNKQVAIATADVQKARKEKAQKDMDRDEALFKDGALTRKQLEDSRSNFETAMKQLSANNEQIALAGSQNASSEAQLKRAEAIILAKKAALESAKLKLSFATVNAPNAGKVGKVNVRKGQYVTPGQPLFSIINDTQFWIVANFKETQLENLKVGQEATIVLDGFPDTELKGKIASFSDATGAKYSLLPPDNATGNFVKVTQRVPVKIEITDAAKYRNMLKAGLSAEVNVIK
jgi:membrane fusion protein (multidrug efflux system)